MPLLRIIPDASGRPRILYAENCGDGAGGFQAGNSCGGIRFRKRNRQGVARDHQRPRTVRGPEHAEHLEHQRRERAEQAAYVRDERATFAASQAADRQSLRKEHAAALRSLAKDHARALAQLDRRHDRERSRMKHPRLLASRHARELSALAGEHAAELATLRAVHARERRDLRDEQHADASENRRDMLRGIDDHRQAQRTDLAEVLRGIHQDRVDAREETTAAMPPLRIAYDASGRFRVLYGASVPLRSVGGKLVSARSKAGSSACSQAASNWRNRKATPDDFKQLSQCRAQASSRRQAESHRLAGNDLRASVLEHRADTGKAGATHRAELAEKLKAVRAGKHAVPAAHAMEHAAAPDPIARGRQQAADRERFAANLKGTTRKVALKPKTAAHREATGAVADALRARHDAETGFRGTDDPEMRGLLFRQAEAKYRTAQGALKSLRREQAPPPAPVSPRGEKPAPAPARTLPRLERDPTSDSLAAIRDDYRSTQDLMRRLGNDHYAALDRYRLTPDAPQAVALKAQYQSHLNEIAGHVADLNRMHKRLTGFSLKEGRFR